jgi:hypothetical protein
MRGTCVDHMPRHYIDTGEHMTGHSDNLLRSGPQPATRDRRPCRLAAAAIVALLSACGSDPGWEAADVTPKEVTIAWDAPALKDDGTVLTDLAGYRLYYGQRSGDYPYMLEIDDPAATMAVLTLPADGTWYVSAKSYRINGVESRPTAEIVIEHLVL